MLLTIENDHCICAIDTLGAQMRRFYDKQANDEILWQGNPQVWSGSAPVLFPVIGRMKSGGYSYAGKRYDMPKHGLVRTEEFSVISQKAERLVLSLSSTDAMQDAFPFSFELVIEFSLHEKKVCVNYSVYNRCNEEMIFSLGSHPAIKLPQMLENYVVAFDSPQSTGCFRIVNGLVGAEAESMLDDIVEIPLSSSLFENDALVFKEIDTQKIMVKNRSGNRVIEVTTGGAPSLGIWTLPVGGYVCIEPWYGYDDPIDCSGKLEEKPGTLRLEPGKVFTTGYTIQRL